MDDKNRAIAAPCGLYCGACLVYRANKRGENGVIEEMKKQAAKRIDELVEDGRMKGMPPPAKGCDYSQLKKVVQEEEDYMCCEGCLSDVVALPCRICGFRACAQEKGITNCSECPEMPCQWVIDFKNDGIPHHADVLVNLERQKEIGIDAWLAEQEKKWRCVQCGSMLAWYDAECPDCHAAQMHTYGASPFSTK